jgi:hypothetical protein
MTARRYAAIDGRSRLFPLGGWLIEDRMNANRWDRVPTRTIAEHAARELNAGRATFYMHSIVGCRVQPFPTRNLGGVIRTHITGDDGLYLYVYVRDAVAGPWATFKVDPDGDAQLLQASCARAIDALPALRAAAVET